MLSRVIKNTSCCNIDNENMLRKVTVNIGPKRIDTQEVIVEALLEKIERPIYVRNIDGSFNKEGSIEYMVEVNIYYQGYREKTEIDVIGG